MAHGQLQGCYALGAPQRLQRAEGVLGSLPCPSWKLRCFLLRPLRCPLSYMWPAVPLPRKTSKVTPPAPLRISRTRVRGLGRLGGLFPAGG